jgi:hypothetical protein
MLGTDRLIKTLRGHKKPAVLAGAVLALAGAGTGTANAATISPAAAAAHAAPVTAEARASAARGHADGARPGAHGPRRPAAGKRAAVRWHRGRWHRTDSMADTWSAVSARLNDATNPAAARLGQLPMADRLLPTALSGPQSYLPISPAQYANAATIVRQALDKRMGVRSAVIAVATAMQESELINVDYGTSDSLGLFQQQPDCGWGSAAQVMDPKYAADAFLDALARYQANDPSWAAQPLYQAAQGVQASAFPEAYAKWEAQAASLVKSIAMQLR